MQELYPGEVQLWGSQVPRSSVSDDVLGPVHSKLPGRIEQLLKCEGGAGDYGTILPYVGHLQLISILKIGADCCLLCQ